MTKSRRRYTVSENRGNQIIAFSEMLWSDGNLLTNKYLYNIVLGFRHAKYKNAVLSAILQKKITKFENNYVTDDGIFFNTLG